MTSTGGRTVPVHGGRVTVSPRQDELRVEATPLRHLHPVAWLAALVAGGAGLYGVATGWRYTAETGGAVGGWHLLAVGLAVGLGGAVAALRRRRRGFGPGTVALSSVTGARVTTTRVRWYLKTRRAVPVLVLEADTGTRRVLFRPRYDPTDVRRTVDALEAAGVDVTVETAARGLMRR